MTACTQKCSKAHEDMTAEEVVQAYLDLAFNIQDISQKETLIEFTRGNLQAALAGANEETFTEAYISRKYKVKNFSIMDRRDRTPRETEITFQLTYLDFPENPKEADSSAEVTTQNTVSLIKEKEKWYLREVVGSETTFDFPISEFSKITSPSNSDLP